MGQFALTGEMAAPRSGAAGGPHIEGYAFVVGGGQPDAEVYRFATIKTDKDDYAPGQTAIITGSGWGANERVTLLFQEDPAVHADYVVTVTADGDGNIYHDQWAPEQHDLGVRFYLMAIGQRIRTTSTDDVYRFNQLSKSRLVTSRLQSSLKEAVRHTVTISLTLLRIPKRRALLERSWPTTTAGANATFSRHQVTRTTRRIGDDDR